MNDDDQQQKKRHGGSRPGSGRPPISKASATVMISAKVSAAQREKLARLGGSSWLRRQIDEAPEPAIPKRSGGGRKHGGLGRPASDKTGEDATAATDPAGEL